MVATENKTLHDKLQSLFDREKIAQSPKNRLPIACEFGKELARNHLFDNIKQTVAETGKPYFARSFELKTKAFDELNAAKNLLLQYKDTIPALSFYLQEYEDTEKTSRPMSWEQAYALDYVLRKASLLIRNDRSTDHSVIIKKLIKFGENGQVVGYIFSQSLAEWQYYIALIERDKKTALWYSMHYLIHFHELNDIEKRLKKRHALLQDNQHFALYCFDLEVKNFDEALEQHDVQKALLLGFDIEECRIHLHHVWEFIKPLLLAESPSSTTEVSNNKQSSEAQSNATEYIYTYTDKSGFRSGTVTKGNIDSDLTGTSAALLFFLIKRKQPIHYDAIKGVAEENSNTSKKDQIKNARRTINTNLMKAFHFKKQVVTSKNGILDISWSYKSCIHLKE
ncbi:MAG: hypothetical protein K2X90_00235 [Candidatus Babeliaceae bacterium]|nr:hypothetical protein [Candidatus Babeliaceae bacterium]